MYTNYLHFMVQIEILKGIKAMKIVMDAETVWNGAGEGKCIEKDSKRTNREA